MFILTDTPKEFIPLSERDKEQPLTFILKPPTKKAVLEIQETLFKSLNPDSLSGDDEVSTDSIPLATLMDAHINVCVVGWKNVFDKDMNPIIFSPEKLNLFNDSTILMELYNECRELSESTEKN